MVFLIIIYPIADINWMSALKMNEVHLGWEGAPIVQ